MEDNSSLFDNFNFNFLTFKNILLLPLLTLYATALYLLGTLLFDTLHYLLHLCSKSTSPILVKIGYLHQIHHLYFNRRLHFNRTYLLQNTLIELPLELSSQILGTYLGHVLISLITKHLLSTSISIISQQYLDIVFYVVVVFEVVRILVVGAMEGIDSNHITYPHQIPHDPNTILVGPQYHALHHVDPASYIGSTIRVFDWIFGLASPSLKARRVTITTIGSSRWSAGIGKAMRKEMENKGVRVINELSVGEGEWGYEDCERIIEVLKGTDILILIFCHEDEGERKRRNEAGCQTLIELFKRYRKGRKGDLLMGEIWNLQMKSRNEGGGKSKCKERYLGDEMVVYRHIVIPRLGLKGEEGERGVKGLVKVMLWWISRGARDIPLGYTRWGGGLYGIFTWLSKILGNEKEARA